MKQLFAILLLAICATSCRTQKPESPLILQQTLHPNLQDSTCMNALVLEQNGNRTWKKHFQYIDSLNVESITYLSDGLKINGFVASPKAEGNYPCIIWNRGGVKEYGAFNLVRVAALLGKLASHGYVVIATQYRGNGGSEGREEFGGAEINDVLVLTEVLNEIPNADTSKIGMFGGSRGGMMTYLALTKTSKIKAAAVLGAPADKYASIADRPSLESSMIELVEGYAENKTQELNKRSAIKWADQFPKNVPLLIMHGNADWRVKSSQSLALALELDKYRVPYKLIIYEGGDHGLSEHRELFFNDLIAWFDVYLKQGAALPNMVFHGN